MKIAASLLAFDFSKLNEQFLVINKCVDWLHYDVMDGQFVNNISFGPDVLADIRKLTSLYLDVHLMISDPFAYADRFIDCGAELLTFHYEALSDDNSVYNLIDHIKGCNIKCGISIKPNTDPSKIAPFLDVIDLVLVMSVEPGFGGQSFLASAYDKITYFNEFRRVNNLDYLIEVDGGINNKNAASLVECGADILVSGSYLLKGDIQANVQGLKK